MGSTSSIRASSQSQMSTRTALGLPSGAFNCSHPDIQEQFESYVFTQKSVWARPLDDKIAIEMARITGEALTVGLASIARSTAGNSNHWAFVAKGNHTKHKDRKAYYVAQFGMGDFIPTNWTGERDVQFHGILTKSKEIAKLACCSIWENTKNVWIHKEWKPCNAPHNLLDLERAIRSTPCSERSYSALKNNCQHFAGHLYDHV